MARLSVKEILLATGGKLLHGGAATEIDGVSIDSRTIRPGELFVSIVGQHLDGHSFAHEAICKGAAGLLLSSWEAYRKVLTQIAEGGNGSLPIIQADDTVSALQNLARYARDKNSIPVIAVTGSNGKTTTKELIANVLEERYRVLKSPGNLNNLVGLPLSLLQMSHDYDVAVLEMGMNSPGEIGALSRIARPNVGVVTNISAAHIGGLGSMEKILEAKGELVDSLGSEDAAALNMDDPWCARLATRVRGRLITFGKGEGYHVRCRKIESQKADGITFTLEMGSDSFPVHLKTPGSYNAYNAAAAAAAGLAMGVKAHEIKAALQRYKGLPMRSEIIYLGQGIKIYNDCYNANPKSMEEALKAFAGLTLGGGSTVILGDMLELGERSAQFHREVGRLVASLKGIKLLSVGNFAGDVVSGALEGGLSRKKAFAVATAEGASELVPSLLNEGQWVMVKGSRGMHMEKVVERLKKIVGED